MHEVEEEGEQSEAEDLFNNLNWVSVVAREEDNGGGGGGGDFADGGGGV